MNRGETVTKGKKHCIAKILDDSGEEVGYAIFDLDGKQVSEAMSRPDAGKWLKRLDEDEEDKPPPPSGSGSGRLRHG